MEISDVTEKKQSAFAQWSCAKAHSVSYIARNLSVLSAALKLALGARAPKTWAWPATIADWLDLPEPEPSDWIPADEQLAEFLDSLTSNQADHVFRYSILALNLLARPTAILQLMPKQVDHGYGLITLKPVGLRRNKKRRPITRIPASLEPWLDFWDTDDDDIP